MDYTTPLNSENQLSHLHPQETGHVLIRKGTSHELPVATCVNSLLPEAPSRTPLIVAPARRGTRCPFEAAAQHARPRRRVPLALQAVAS